MNELKKTNQWVNWKLDPARGKIPKNPKTGGNAQSNNPATWASYELAEKVRGKYDGVGFMFSNGICGIDIDGANDPARAETAKEIIAHMNTYTEYSPSGNGYHLIFKCDLSRIPQKDGKLDPAYYQKNPNNGLECYFSGLTNRFFTYTGEAISNNGIEDRTEQVLAFLDKYMKQKKNPPQRPTATEDSGIMNAPINRIDVLSIARKAKNGKKFMSLYDAGDISPYNGDDSSADIALCNMLAFYCRGDFDEIDRLFRDSKLYREKWEREDYRTKTINKGIEICNGQFYRPPGRPKKERPQFGDDGQSEFVTVSNLSAYLNENGISTRYNEINHIQNITGLSPIYGNEHSQDILPVIVYDKLRFFYEKVTKGDIRDFLNVIAIENKYNPVLDMLKTLKWDKTDRLPELFAILGLYESDRLSKTLIYKWLWQCLSMARNVLGDNQSAYGADGLLVLVGKQGIGKTSFFRKLAIMQDFFYEGNHLDFRDKDTLIRASSAWITELGEVESTLRSDVEKLKAYITNKTDMYRRPYGHGDLHLARHTSFCATCNSTKYLIDPEGNRRFWSVPVEHIDLDALSKIDIVQLWAQVDEKTHTRPQGFRLTKEEQAELNLRNSGHEKPLKGEMEIRDLIAMTESKSKDLVFKNVTISEFKQAHDVLKNYSVQQLAAALDKIGIESLGREYIDGRQQRVRTLPVWKGSGTGAFLEPVNIPDSENPFLQPAVGR